MTDSAEQLLMTPIDNLVRRAEERGVGTPDPYGFLPKSGERMELEVLIDMDIEDIRRLGFPLLPTREQGFEDEVIALFIAGVQDLEVPRRLESVEEGIKIFQNYLKTQQKEFDSRVRNTKDPTKTGEKIILSRALGAYRMLDAFSNLCEPEVFSELRQIMSLTTSLLCTAESHSLDPNYRVTDGSFRASALGNFVDISLRDPELADYCYDLAEEISSFEKTQLQEGKLGALCELATINALIHLDLGEKWGVNKLSGLEDARNGVDIAIRDDSVMVLVLEVKNARNSGEEGCCTVVPSSGNFATFVNGNEEPSQATIKDIPFTFTAYCKARNLPGISVRIPLEKILGELPLSARTVLDLENTPSIGYNAFREDLLREITFIGKVRST